ncbi:hypothetical protein DM860_006992 [Cuscuta australis]|uniref:Uncharacterized protein n=1 Tax=Cuscuta australis TaxID=267555 RepID=A0A328E6X9_9ASTE|nr:hypothetical protein DM860_006992 [Cuscuta australis]
MQMANTGEDDNDAVLSDVEEDESAEIGVKTLPPEDFSPEKFRELLGELDRERQLRAAAESSKSELQVSFGRLKNLAHEAIKKRDECTRQRDEAFREKEEASRTIEKLSGELSLARTEKDEISKQRDEFHKQLEEVMKAKESSRVEIETAASMLVTGIDKISGKVSHFKNFAAGGLPRSHKYTGLPAVAYGVIKRTNEIVEEMLRQVELAAKGRNEARELMEQRNYEIAIEISQLESTISSLREEVSKKNTLVEELQSSVAEKDGKFSELESQMVDKLSASETEVLGLKKKLVESDGKASSLESKMDLQRSLLAEQLNYVSKIHQNICNVIKVVDSKKSSELSESLFLAQQMDMEENIRASLAGLDSIYELTQIVVDKTIEFMDERNHEVKGLDETVSQLMKEKEQIGSLLRSALSRRASADLSSKTNELFKIAENGLKEAGISYNFSGHLREGKVTASDDRGHDDVGILDTEDDIYALAGALENIIKQSQLEIIEFKHSVEELRTESSLLNKRVEAQAKELIHWKQRVEELEEKERVANENVEGLMLDIAAAEEEISRWRIAAEEEAAAGKDVEQKYMAQLSAVRQELEEAKQAAIESEKKLKFKEETAAAAIAARDAAAKSLALADSRAARLRDRVEELSRQLEELDSGGTFTSGLTRPRYICWPWQWLGLDFVGSRPAETREDNANEMELSEPLL